MAKKSSVEKQARRERTVKKFAKKRAEYKRIIQDPHSTDDERNVGCKRCRGIRIRFGFATAAPSRVGRVATTASSASRETSFARPRCAARFRV
jgi:hypothetical protein